MILYPEHVVLINISVRGWLRRIEISVTLAGFVSVITERYEKNEAAIIDANRANVHLLSQTVEMVAEISQDHLGLQVCKGGKGDCTQSER